MPFIVFLGKHTEWIWQLCWLPTSWTKNFFGKITPIWDSLDEDYHLLCIEIRLTTSYYPEVIRNRYGSQIKPPDMADISVYFSGPEDI